MVHRSNQWQSMRRSGCLFSSLLRKLINKKEKGGIHGLSKDKRKALYHKRHDVSEESKYLHTLPSYLIDKTWMKKYQTCNSLYL